MSCDRRSFPRLSLLALVLAGLATSAAASEVDSWGGQIWLRHETDVFAWPHRALEFENSATLVFVPPTSTAGDFRAVSPYQQVAGVLTFGQANWQGILGANVPNFFNPLQAHGSGTQRGWGKALEVGDLNDYHLTVGIPTFPEGAPSPTGMMHLGAAFQATDALGLGATVQTFGHEWSEEVVPGAGPAAKRGFDISGWSLSGSGGLDLGGAISNLELAVAYGSADKEQFDEGTFAGGTGSASSFSIAGHALRDDVGWISSRHDLQWNTYLRFDKTSSDFTDRQDPAIVTGAPKLEDDYNAFDARVGLSYENGDGFLLGASLAFKNDKDEEKFTTPAGRNEFELKTTRFPCCDFAGDLPVWKGLGFQYGMRAFWESNKLTLTDFDAAGTQTNKSEQREKGVGTSYHAGLLWDITEAWRVTATLDTDQLGDPGGAVFGNNVDAPFIAIGARVAF